MSEITVAVGEKEGRHLEALGAQEGKLMYASICLYHTGKTRKGHPIFAFYFNIPFIPKYWICRVGKMVLVLFTVIHFNGDNT